MNAVVARWDGFLAQVRERFLAVLKEAREGCPALLQQSDLDPLPMGNAWGAIERRAKDLESKIEDTWFGQVDGAFEQAGAPPEAIAHERRKADAVRDFMEVERERTRIAIWSDAGRAIFARAIADQGRALTCVRCGSPLTVPVSFRALNVQCVHCHTVNGFEPGARMRLAEVCLHPLCEEAAWQEWVALHAAETAWRRARPVTIHHLKAWERAQIAFWRAYLGARIRMLPETAQAFEADLRGRMRAFYESMDRERPWIEAGRPRDLV